MTIFIPFRTLYYTRYIRTCIERDIYWSENPRYNHYIRTYAYRTFL